MNPIIVAAAKFELDPLTSALQEKGHTPEFRLTGIGIVNAARKSRAIAEACRGRNVIFVGTCGAFGPISRVSLVRAEQVIWSPTCERMGFSYTVRDTAPPISLPDPPGWAKTLPARRVLCSPGISLVGKLPDGVAAETAVENLELYGVIGEIASMASSLAVVLAITNQVGADSHTQWRQNFGEAAGLTAEWISGKLGSC